MRSSRVRAFDGFTQKPQWVLLRQRFVNLLLFSIFSFIAFLSISCDHVLLEDFDMQAIALRPHLPTPVDRELARNALARMQESAVRKEAVKISTRKGAPLDLPNEAAQLLLDILEHMARGDAVTLIPLYAELTTQQAADLLNVSRPTLVKLLEERRLTYHKPGRHRRIKFEEVMRYKQETEKARNSALDELAEIGQEIEEL